MKIERATVFEGSYVQLGLIMVLGLIIPAHSAHFAPLAALCRSTQAVSAEQQILVQRRGPNRCGFGETHSNGHHGRTRVDLQTMKGLSFRGRDWSGASRNWSSFQCLCLPLSCRPTWWTRRMASSSSHLRRYVFSRFHSLAFAHGLTSWTSLTL